VRRDARRTLVAYDIPDDRRRLRIGNALAAYGDRVQYSVFLVDIGPVKLARLIRQLESLMTDDDSILIGDLGPVDGGDSRCTFLGRRSGIKRDFVI